MKKITFKTGLLIYAIVLALVIGALLLGLRGILVKYEKAQAYNLVEGFVKELESNLVFNNIEASGQHIDYSAFSKFEDKDSVIKNYVSVFGGKKLEYALSSQSYDANRPVYIIHSGDLIAGELELNLVSEEIKLDMLSVPTWAISKFTPDLSAIGKTYAVTVPKEYAVKINGHLLSEEDIVSEENGVCAYMVKGLSAEPAVQITDGEGQDVHYTVAKSEQSDRLYNIKSDYIILNFTIPSSFAINTDKKMTATAAGDLTTYSVVFRTMPDSGLMNEQFVITDFAGNVMKFIDKDGAPVPEYYEYTLICPDTLTARIGTKAIDRTNAEKLPIELKQYAEVNSLLKCSFFTIAPIITEDDGSGAAFAITDNAGNEVPYTLSNGVVSVEARDIEITVPDNFGLLIAGSAPDVEGTVKDIREYEDVKQYTNVPKAVTYVLKGQYCPVKLDITDNRGDSSVRYAFDEVKILEQSGSDDVPAGLAAFYSAGVTEPGSGKINPLYYGKQYSYFMTNDIAGDTNGYWAIRKYIYNGSYLDTSCKAWATGVDITFLGRHVFDNPPFSKESVKNYVMLADDCFYCDIYFVKSFTVTSNGVHRDDIFYKRIYFKYCDDDKDGKNTWVIIHMGDLT